MQQALFSFSPLRDSYVFAKSRKEEKSRKASGTTVTLPCLYAYKRNELKGQIILFELCTGIHRYIKLLLIPVGVLSGGNSVCEPTVFRLRLYMSVQTPAVCFGA